MPLLRLLLGIALFFGVSSLGLLRDELAARRIERALAQSRAEQRIVEVPIDEIAPDVRDVRIHGPYSLPADLRPRGNWLSRGVLAMQSSTENLFVVLHATDGDVRVLVLKPLTASVSLRHDGGRPVLVADERSAR